MQGLTHPATGQVRWFGIRLEGWFFRLVDGDERMAVLREPHATGLVDTVTVDGGESDPRAAMKKAATDWLRRRGQVRRAS
jgi:hypothetical protein